MTDRPKVIILGGGPNRIGQGIEFDYCCVHACFALRDLGYETIMINCNPETVSTDYDTADRLYFEPLTLEDVLNIWERNGMMGLNGERENGARASHSPGHPISCSRAGPVWRPDAANLAHGPGSGRRADLGHLAGCD